jgi:FtsP/CotA-like multicopper oxidase with cupredoxin domain
MGLVALVVATACNSQDSSASPLTSAIGAGIDASDPLPVKLGYTARPQPTAQEKAYELVVRRSPWELMDGLTVEAVTYNGTVPGPTIRATEGDTLKVTVKNELDQDTSIHWHGLHIPNDMDGVPGVTQDPIRQGESFTYEFTATHAGTFMYHPHINSVAQIDNGLYGLLVIDPQQADSPSFDQEFSMMLGAWIVGTRPAATQMGAMGQQIREMGAQMVDLEQQMGMMGPTGGMNGQMDNLRQQMGNSGQEIRVWAPRWRMPPGKWSKGSKPWEAWT